MKIDGRCHCGSITYEAEIDPDTVAICHCTDCQTLSGSAFRVVVPAKADRFKLLTGEPKIYVKTGESGRQRVQSFCAELRHADLFCGRFEPAAVLHPRGHGAAARRVAAKGSTLVQVGARMDDASGTGDTGRKAELLSHGEIGKPDPLRVQSSVKGF